mgnify:CR=1 FL=1
MATHGAEERGASPGKQPRTARGLATLRKLLDAAAAEFAERGFHEASISGITRRAGTALGSFYTYFDSKDAIFSALVQDMSQQVAKAAAAGVSPGSTGIAREREALAAFLAFARAHPITPTTKAPPAASPSASRPASPNARCDPAMPRCGPGRSWA